MILTRRSAPLTVGALLTALLLTGCGFNQATNRVNQITHGTTDRVGSVDIIHALVVSSSDDSGTLVGQLVNNDEEAHSLVEIEGGESAQAGEFEPVEVAGDGSAQLQDADVRVTGDFAAGEYITLTLAFDNNEQRELRLPVVAACDEFEGLDDAPHAEGEEEGEHEAYDCETAEAPDAGH